MKVYAIVIIYNAEKSVGHVMDMQEASPVSLLSLQTPTYDTVWMSPLNYILTWGICSCQGTSSYLPEKLTCSVFKFRCCTSHLHS